MFQLFYFVSFLENGDDLGKQRRGLWCVPRFSWCNQVQENIYNLFNAFLLTYFGSDSVTQEEWVVSCLTVKIRLKIGCFLCGRDAWRRSIFWSCIMVQIHGEMATYMSRGASFSVCNTSCVMYMNYCMFNLWSFPFFNQEQCLH
jgi:hypothetical protein